MAIQSNVTKKNPIEIQLNKPRHKFQHYLLEHKMTLQWTSVKRNWKSMPEAQTTKNDQLATLLKA